jgi:hypothetical protein
MPIHVVYLVMPAYLDRDNNIIICMYVLFKSWLAGCLSGSCLVMAEEAYREILQEKEQQRCALEAEQRRARQEEKQRKLRAKRVLAQQQAGTAPAQDPDPVLDSGPDIIPRSVNIMMCCAILYV